MFHDKDYSFPVVFQHKVNAKQIRLNWLVGKPQMYTNDLFKVNQQTNLTFCSQEAQVKSKKKCSCWKTFFLFLNAWATWNI